MKTRWIRRSRFCTICFLILSVILIIAASLSPYTLNEIKWGKAQERTQLSQKNERNWIDLPNNAGIYWNQYFYNCTNVMDVIYSNAKPQFQEFGPYVYRETDNYTDKAYADDLDFNGNPLPVVNATYRQYVTFDSDPTDTIDEPLYLTN